MGSRREREIIMPKKERDGTKKQQTKLDVVKLYAWDTPKNYRQKRTKTML